MAVKIINKARLDAKTQKMVQREIKIMDSLSHPNLIRLVQDYSFKNLCYLSTNDQLKGVWFLGRTKYLVGRTNEWVANPLGPLQTSALQIKTRSA